MYKILGNYKKKICIPIGLILYLLIRPNFLGKYFLFSPERKLFLSTGLLSKIYHLNELSDTDDKHGPKVHTKLKRIKDFYR